MCKSRLARLVHNVVVVWMLVESHTRVPQGYVWRRWCVGVREHWRHHSALVYNDEEREESATSGSKRHDIISARTNPESSATTTSTPKRRHRYQQFFGHLDQLLVLLGKA